MLKIDRVSKHGAFLSMDECNGEYKGGFLSLLNPLIVEATSGKKEEPKPEPLPEPIEAEQQVFKMDADAPKKKKKGRRK